MRKPTQLAPPAVDCACYTWSNAHSTVVTGALAMPKREAVAVVGLYLAVLTICAALCACHAPTHVPSTGTQPLLQVTHMKRFVLAVHVVPYCLHAAPWLPARHCAQSHHGRAAVKKDNGQGIMA